LWATNDGASLFLVSHGAPRFAATIVVGCPIIIIIIIIIIQALRH